MSAVRFHPKAPLNFLSGYAGVAQLVEQLICNQPVAGSSPVTSSTTHIPDLSVNLIFWADCRVAKCIRL